MAFQKYFAYFCIEYKSSFSSLLIHFWFPYLYIAFRFVHSNLRPFNVCLFFGQNYRTFDKNYLKILKCFVRLVRTLGLEIWELFSAQIIGKWIFRFNFAFIAWKSPIILLSLWLEFTSLLSNSFVRREKAFYLDVF